MGITIHYSFVKREIPKDLLSKAKLFAKKLNWEVLEDSENCLILHPQENCESVALEFKQLKEVRKIEGYDYIKNILKDFKLENENENIWLCSMFCKTQYAGSKVHIEVAEFLRFIASYCYMSSIIDEADYYEKGFNEKSLKEVNKEFDESSKMISAMIGQFKDMFGKDRVYTPFDSCL